MSDPVRDAFTVFGMWCALSFVALAVLALAATVFRRFR
jgi:hypothetical protein